MNNSNGKTRRLAGLALFTAIVVVLQLLGSFINGRSGNTNTIKVEYA